MCANLHLFTLHPVPMPDPDPGKPVCVQAPLFLLFPSKEVFVLRGGLLSYIGLLFISNCGYYYYSWLRRTTVCFILVNLVSFLLLRVLSLITINILVHGSCVCFFGLVVYNGNYN